MKNVKKGPAIHEFIELMNGGAELSSKIFLILFGLLLFHAVRNNNMFSCLCQQVCQFIGILIRFNIFSYGLSTVFCPIRQRIRNDFPHPTSDGFQLIQFGLPNFNFRPQRIDILFKLCLACPQRLTLNGLRQPKLM